MADHLHPPDIRHAEIGDNDIDRATGGVVVAITLEQPNTIATIRGVANDLDPWIIEQDQFQASADDTMIVDENDPNVLGDHVPSDYVIQVRHIVAEDHDGQIIWRQRCGWQRKRCRPRTTPHAGIYEALSVLDVLVGPGLSLHAPPDHNRARRERSVRANPRSGRVSGSGGMDGSCLDATGRHVSAEPGHPSMNDE